MLTTMMIAQLLAALIGTFLFPDWLLIPTDGLLESDKADKPGTALA
jgi:hypothetical protein